MKLALGTVQFGIDYGISNTLGKTPQDEVNKILSLAHQYKISTLDTSSTYGNSEAALGQSDNLLSFKIITKTPSFSEGTITKKHLNLIESTFHDSLTYLKQNAIDGLLIHACDDLYKPGGEYIFKTIEKLKYQGFIKKIGVSVYNNEQLKYITSHFNIDLVQLPFNIFDQRLLHNGTLSALKKKQIEIHTRSTFLQGLLLMPIDKLPDYFMPFHHHLKRFDEYASALNLSKVELALGFVNNIDEIDKVVCGINNTQQLSELVTASKHKVNIKLAKHLATTNEGLICPVNWT